ncbi:MFS general substrate transporter [Ramaria rubella]|nr:MFS general substrate transporter [Ramaria rubella]
MSTSQSPRDIEKTDSQEATPKASVVARDDKHRGTGAIDDPFIVDWDENDPENPRQWTRARRWLLTVQLALGTWNISFTSSSYSGGLNEMTTALQASRTVAVLGLSLYVLGFGVGPLLFAPLSEMYGRRIVFLCSYTPYLFFHLGGALATNIQTVVICRFLGGILGSAPISNAGGQVADMWSPHDRGLPNGIYSLCTFFGPVSGPIVGGFISQSFGNGWRINFWVMFGLSGLIVLWAFFNLAETYPPVLLRRRAHRLHVKSNGLLYYRSIHDREQASKQEKILTSLKRPFVFLVKEPIVTLISIYISIAYGSLYAQFVAFPIVFQEHRHFSPGDSGLAFLGIALGQWIGIASTPLQNRLYWRAMAKGGGKVLPEARLYGAVVTSMALPLGMFWFAWTSPPSFPAVLPVLSGIPFGLGTILIIINFNAYLMDAYSLYCASALASTILLRSICAAAFPLISSPMFDALGDEWASSVFAFIALACAPVPFLFFKYGKWIRSKSKYALHTIDIDDPEDTLDKPDEIAEGFEGKSLKGVHDRTRPSDAT